MKLPMPQNKKLITAVLVLALILASALIFLPQEARARVVPAGESGQCPLGHGRIPSQPNLCGDKASGNPLADAFAWVIARVLYAFGAFIGLLLSWEAALIGVVLNPNFFGGYTRVDGVRIGWTITRDLANLGLVLALIVIAISTILRLESYGMRRTLWRLIVAAILINFSLLIGGIIIDTANLITYFFVNANSSNPQACHLNTYSRCFAHAFRITELIQRTSNETEGSSLWQVLTGTAGSLLVTLSSLLFAVTFSLVALIVLGALLVMLVIRVVWLWILLILAPIAWVSYIFPATQKSWNDWWHRFIKWSFFAPIVSFFIYLSFQIIFRLSGADPTKGVISWEGFFDNQGAQLLQTASAPSWILQFAVFIGLLIASLVVANSMAGGVAGQALGLATAAARWPTLAAARFARRAAVGSGAANRAADWLSTRTGVLRPIGQQVARGITAAQVREAQALKKEIDKVKDFDARLLAREANLPGIAGLRAIHALAQSNKLGELEKAVGRKRAEQLIARAYPSATNLGLKDAKEAYDKFAPAMAISAGKKIEDIARSYSRDDIEKISDAAWSAILEINGMIEAIQKNWGPQKFQAVFDRGGVLYEELQKKHRELGSGWLAWYQSNNKALAQYLLKNRELWGLPEIPQAEPASAIGFRLPPTARP